MSFQEVKIDPLQYHLVPGMPLDIGASSEEVWDPEDPKWLEETDIQLERLWLSLEQDLMRKQCKCK